MAARKPQDPWRDGLPMSRFEDVRPCKTKAECYNGHSNSREFLFELLSWNDYSAVGPGAFYSKNWTTPSAVVTPLGCLWPVGICIFFYWIKPMLTLIKVLQVILCFSYFYADITLQRTQKAKHFSSIHPCFRKSQVHFKKLIGLLSEIMCLQARWWRYLSHRENPVA